MDEQERIAGEILAASFWENWNYLKELGRMNSPKKLKQREEAEKIRKDWIAHQQKNQNQDG